MSDDDSREGFHQFLTKNLTDEHFDFYMDVMTYENMTSKKRRNKLGTKIFNTYLSDSAPRLINVPNDTLEKVAVQFEKGAFEDMLFEDCKNAVMKLLVLDSFPRYLEKEKRMRKKSKRGRARSVNDEEREGRPKKKQKSKRGKSEVRKNRMKRDPKHKGRKTTKSVDSVRKRKVSKTKEKKKNKRGSSTEKMRKALKKKNLPLNFDDAVANEHVKSQFYDFLVKSYSNEYLDFYDEVMTFQNTLFEEDEDIRKAVNKICHKYLGIGEGADYLISVNFEVMDDFKERLERKEINVNNIFTLILSEAKTILKQQYHNYLSQLK